MRDRLRSLKLDRHNLSFYDTIYDSIRMQDLVGKESQLRTVLSIVIRKRS